MTPERIAELRAIQAVAEDAMLVYYTSGYTIETGAIMEELLDEIERLNKLVWRLKHRVEQAWRDLGDSQSYEGNP